MTYTVTAVLLRGAAVTLSQAWSSALVDRVKPLKIESPDSGGTQTDDFPTSVNKNQDYIDSRGSAYQNDVSDDDAVLVSRDASDNMTFQDGHVAPISLTALTAGGFDFNNVIWDAAGGIVYANDESAVTKL